MITKKDRKTITENSVYVLKIYKREIEKFRKITHFYDLAQQSIKSQTFDGKTEHNLKLFLGHLEKLADFWVYNDLSQNERCGFLTDEIREILCGKQCFEKDCPETVDPKEGEDLTKCDECGQEFCMWHIMGDGTTTGGLYCDGKVNNCLKKRKKAIDKCKHKWILKSPTQKEHSECSKCGLMSEEKI